MVRVPESSGCPGSLPRSVRRFGRWGRSTAAGFTTRHPGDDGRVGHPVRCTNTPRASRAIRFPKPDVLGAAPGRRASFRETFRPAACKSAVAKAAGRRRLERYQRFPPVHGSVAQVTGRPFGRPQGPAGRLRAQVPSDPPNPTAERPSKEGRFRFPTPRRAIRAAGGFLPDGVKGARRPVKPSVPVRVRVRQPVFRSQGASDLHAAPRRRRFVVQVHVGAPIQMPNAEFGLWNSDASRSFGPLAPIPHSPFRVPHFHVPECKESRSRPFTPGLAGASPAGDTSLMLVMM